MGQSLQSGSVNVNGTVTASGTFTEAIKTLVVVNAVERTSAGSTTLGTVPANKVWRIIHGFVTGRVNNGNGSAKLELNGASVLAVNTSASATENNNQALSIRFDYQAAPLLTAGQTVVFTTVSSQSGWCGFSYVEEAA